MPIRRRKGIGLMMMKIIRMIMIMIVSDLPADPPEAGQTDI